MLSFLPVGMSSPGAFTCGAVESCAQKDYLEKDGATYISMVITAARGLDEELLVKLEGGDLEAICLSTVYLKFDNHEWGMCGYVDLSDQRIRPENRLSYARLSSRFSSGPKDKFEHEEIFAVDFELESMVGFIKEHHRQFASSSKLVVVKVMQAFFGVTRVEHAFGSQNVDWFGRGPHSQKLQVNNSSAHFACSWVPSESVVWIFDTFDNNLN